MSQPEVSISDVLVALSERCPVTCLALDQKRNLHTLVLAVTRRMFNLSGLTCYGNF
jgi:hypothetical protein